VVAARHGGAGCTETTSNGADQCRAWALAGTAVEDGCFPD
jgi:hypothetical protein